MDVEVSLYMVVDGHQVDKYTGVTLPDDWDSMNEEAQVDYLEGTYQPVTSDFYVRNRKIQHCEYSEAIIEVGS